MTIIINGVTYWCDSLKEIKDKLDEGKGTLFEIDAEKILEKAAEPLIKLAKLSESSLKDIEEGRSLMQEAKNNISEIKSLCDIITAQPLSKDPNLSGYFFEKFALQKNEESNLKALKLAGLLKLDQFISQLFLKYFIQSKFNVILEITVGRSSCK